MAIFVKFIKWSIIIPTSGTRFSTHSTQDHTSGISFKWYLVHHMVVPQAILNFKWSIQIKKLPSPTRAQVDQVVWHKGEDPHYQVSRLRILQVTYMWHFKVVFLLSHVLVTSGVNTNHLNVSIKNKDSRLNHLPKSNFLHQATRDFHGKIFK